VVVRKELMKCHKNVRMMLMMLSRLAMMKNGLVKSGNLKSLCLSRQCLEAARLTWDEEPNTTARKTWRAEPCRNGSSGCSKLVTFSGWEIGTGIGLAHQVSKPGYVSFEL
jgi:hypothetical protein